MKTKIFTAASVLAFALVPSCSNYGPQQTYRENQIGSTQEVKTGTITKLTPVIINPENRDYGTGLGAVAGGLAGNTFGGGRGKTLYTAGGVLAGALAGNQIDKAVNQQEGYRVDVRLDNEKKTMSVTQAKDPNRPLHVGQHVNIYIGYAGSLVEPSGY